jgi:hypothetical protein
MGDIQASKEYLPIARASLWNFREAGGTNTKVQTSCILRAMSPQVETRNWRQPKSLPASAGEQYSERLRNAVGFDLHKIASALSGWESGAHQYPGFPSVRSRENHEHSQKSRPNIQSSWWFVSCWKSWMLLLRRKSIKVWISVCPIRQAGESCFSFAWWNQLLSAEKFVFKKRSDRLQANFGYASGYFW